MSVLRLEYPEPTTCGHRAALDQPDGDHRRCRLEPGHPLPHVYPSLRTPGGPATGRELGVRLCEILGLDPDRITGLSLHAQVGDLAQVLVTQIVPGDLLDEIVEEIESFELVPR